MEATMNFFMPCRVARFRSSENTAKDARIKSANGRYDLPLVAPAAHGNPPIRRPHTIPDFAPTPNAESRQDRSAAHVKPLAEWPPLLHTEPRPQAAQALRHPSPLPG